MNIFSKVVSLSLLVALLAGVAMPLTHCMARASHSGRMPHCAMMAANSMGGPTLASGISRMANCCRLSPAKPKAVPTAVTVRDISRAALGVDAVSAALIPVRMGKRTSDVIPRAVPVHSQAVLCTFLI